MSSSNLGDPADRVLDAKADGAFSQAAAVPQANTHAQRQWGSKVEVKKDSLTLRLESLAKTGEEGRLLADNVQSALAYLSLAHLPSEINHAIAVKTLDGEDTPAYHQRAVANRAAECYAVLTRTPLTKEQVIAVLANTTKFRTLCGKLDDLYDKIGSLYRRG